MSFTAKRKSLRAVSEIVAAVLLTMIVLSVGSLVLYKYYGFWVESRRGSETLLERVEGQVTEPILSPLYCTYNATSNKLVLIVVVGSPGLEIRSIYANRTRVYETGEPVLLDGEPVSGPLVVLGERMSTLEIQASLPLSPGDRLEILIYSRGGNTATCSGVVVS